MEQSGGMYDSIVDTIGYTPIVKLSLFNKIQGNYYAKLESFNPGGSSKDRIAITIIDDAEKKGLIKPGGTIVEATSGNTGLGLALIGIERNYKVILVMPDKMSPEKMNLVKAMGCEVIVCPTEVEPDDPRSYYSISKKIAEETEGAFFANQYHNEANPIAHYNTTGPEIWEQTKNKITHFIAGIGTGGTISGTAKFLKEMNPDIKIIGVDPVGSILAHYHKNRNTNIEAKGYKVEGVGEDIIPSNVHFDIIDEIVTVNDEESFYWTRKLAKEDGILAGGSSGLAIAGVAKYFEDNDSENYFAVVLLPDTGERYLGKIFSDAWLRRNGFLPAAETIRDILNTKSANLPGLITLTDENTLQEALNKILKFRIDQIAVETSTGIKLLSKEVVYDHFLQSNNSREVIKNLKLDEVHFIDINTPLDELKNEIVKYSKIIIQENNKSVGIITKEDIIDNINF